MRTRWILAASILVLTLLPGTLRAAEVASPAPAPAVAAPASPTASVPAPAALPVWADLNAPLSASQPSPEIARPVFLIGCADCGTINHCRMLHSCVLNGCC
jgi:hypothetical protein